MKICLAQIAPTKGMIQSNIELHVRYIKEAIKLNANCIIFPELSLTSYEPEIAARCALELETYSLNEFQHLSDDHQLTIGVGVPQKTLNGINISLLIFQPNEDRVYYSKRLLHEDELPYFLPGKDAVYLTIDQVKLTFGICYESLQRASFIEAVENNADLYIASVAKPKSGMEKANTYFPAVAQEFETPVLLSNAVGFCDNFTSYGQSSVWNKEGLLLAQMSDTAQGLILYDTESETSEVINLN